MSGGAGRGCRVVRACALSRRLSGALALPAKPDTVVAFLMGADSFLNSRDASPVLVSG